MKRLVIVEEMSWHTTVRFNFKEELKSSRPILSKQRVDPLKVVNYASRARGKSTITLSFGKFIH